jgi:toxin ParE1/3/4
MARVVRTRLSRGDLKEIGRYIARESQSRDVALRFLDVIAKRCATYARNPLLSEACPELGADVRRFPVGNYVVFYRPIRNGIEMLRVIHAARDIPAAWFKRRLE